LVERVRLKRYLCLTCGKVIYYGKKVMFPAPGEAEVPRGKRVTPIGPPHPDTKQQGKRLTPEAIRARNELRCQRDRDHLCRTCGKPARFYPTRKFNQWAKLCDTHLDEEAAYARAKAAQTALKPPASAPLPPTPLQ